MIRLLFCTALCVGAIAASALGQDTRSIALGQKIGTNAANPDPRFRPGEARLPTRLETRLNTRLQSRVERFAPERADARYAYRNQIDDGSRKAATIVASPSLPSPYPADANDPALVAPQ